MTPLSCTNCCFNGLQQGDLGLAVGHCVRHDVVLQNADHTTCRFHFRKDLTAPTAESASLHHQRHFSGGRVQRISDGRDVHDDPVYVSPSLELLKGDAVAEISRDYNLLDETKIGSLARLSDLSGVRAELALYNLGRTYIRRCAHDERSRGGWTSALHVLRWTQEKLASPPKIGVSDLRNVACGVSHERRVELAEWSIYMLRLTLLSDIGTYAAKTNAPERALMGLIDDAALAAGTNPRKLGRWMRGAGQAAVRHIFPAERERALINEIREARRATMG
jgi:hypothetical protein